MQLLRKNALLAAKGGGVHLHPPYPPKSATDITLAMLLKILTSGYLAFLASV